MNAQPTSRSFAPAKPAAAPYVSHAKWAKPVPKPRKNFIPEQSWLAYSWIDRDPEMDLVHSVIAESGMTLEQIEEETIKLGHKVSKWCLMQWCYGDTRRPQNITITMVMLACGYDKRWVRHK